MLGTCLALRPRLQRDDTGLLIAGAGLRQATGLRREDPLGDRGNTVPGVSRSAR